jgi:hypothetical protein
VQRIQKTTERPIDAIARSTLDSVVRGLTLIETLADLRIERPAAHRVTLDRVGGTGKLSVTAHGDAILLRITRGELETLHRFNWVEAGVCWTDGQRELFETIADLLESDV